MSPDTSKDAGLDWLCIPISKKDENKRHCDYLFTATLHASDPEHPGKSKIVGQERGILRIVKATGDISIIEQMPGDDGERRAQRAARIVYRHWQKGEYPQNTIYAAG
jgi:hypothetical protein